MLPDSTLELSWDHEIRNALDPALIIKYIASNSFLPSSSSTYVFAASHKTYSDDVPPLPWRPITFLPMANKQSDSSMTTTTKIRGLRALAAYLDLRCESAGHWRLATIVDKEGMIVYEFSWKGGGGSSRGHGFMDFGFGQKDKWSRTHDELLEVWRNMI